MLNLKAMLGLLSAIAIGIVSSALWDAMKPTAPNVLQFFVRISTFGIESVVDNIYKEVAIGSYERVSLLVLTQIFSFFFVVVTSSILLPFTLRRKAHRDDSPATGASQSYSRYLMRSNKFLYGMIFLMSVAISVLSVKFVSTLYATRAEANIRQLIQIDAAFVDAATIRELQSQSAQIKSRKDYISLDSKLRSIAEKNHISPPDFDIM